MKQLTRFTALLIFSSLANNLQAQVSPDTVNGWYHWRTIGNQSAITYSRIVTDTAAEGTRSQSFYFSTPENTSVEWRKLYSRLHRTPSELKLFLWPNDGNWPPQFTATFRFFLSHGDTLFPLPRAGWLFEQGRTFWEYVIPVPQIGTRPSFFDELVLKFSFSESASGWAEVFFDDLVMIYLSGIQVDSIIVLDRFGDGLVGVEDDGNQLSVVSYQLHQNYPNPFNPVTAISYKLSVRSYVTLKVFSVLGEEVAVLAEGEKVPGTHTVRFDASNLPSGIYFYRLTAIPSGGGETVTLVRKMILLR